MKVLENIAKILTTRTCKKYKNLVQLMKVFRNYLGTQLFIYWQGATIKRD